MDARAPGDPRAVALPLARAQLARPCISSSGSVCTITVSTPAQAAIPGVWPWPRQTTSTLNGSSVRVSNNPATGWTVVSASLLMIGSDL